jgi:hypothetical protein
LTIEVRIRLQPNQWVGGVFSPQLSTDPNEDEICDMTEDEELYAFHFELGRALLAWAEVEYALADTVMCTAKDGTTAHLLGIGFWAIENLRSKLQYADAVLQVRLKNDAPLSARWTALHERIAAKSRMRNALVHGRAIRRQAAKPSERIELVNPATMNDPPEALGIRELVQRGAEFHAVLNSLRNFHHALRELKEPLPEPSSQPIPRPSIRSIEARMRAALGRQPRPSGALPGQSQESKP